MINEREFNHDGDEDFPGNSTASADQDYITPFIYPKGQDCGEETVGKNAARAIAKLFPHNLAEKTKHRKKYYLQTRVLPRQAHPLRSRVPDHQ
jgi:hypothetical protein